MKDIDAIRLAHREKTSLERYGIKTPGNNPAARAKAERTMLSRYGVSSMLELPEVRAKATGKVDQAKRIATRHNNWLSKVHELLPINYMNKESSIALDESEMSIYLLTEQAATSFLKQHSAIRPKHIFGKFHVSLGLVKNNEVFQALRFERLRAGKGIGLTDFGTKTGYYNPKEYAKLMQFATMVRGIETFTAQVPRHLATPQLLISLGLTKVSDGEYEVYWETSEGLRKLTQHDNIQELSKSFMYVTTDWLDNYIHIPNQSLKEIELNNLVSNAQ